MRLGHITSGRHVSLVVFDVHGTRCEDFFGGVEFRQGHTTNLVRDAQFLGQYEHIGACDSRKAMIRVRCQKGPLIIHHENVGGVCFGDISIYIQHDGICTIGQIGLNFGEDTGAHEKQKQMLEQYSDIADNHGTTIRRHGVLVDHVVVVNFGVHRRRGVATQAGGDQTDALGIVIRRGPFGGFPFGKDD